MNSGSAAGWARELALRACAEAGVPPPDVLRWRRADRELSTGLTRQQSRSIAVTAGRDPRDARHTLLHELGHWLTPGVPRRRGRRRQAVHHGREFYVAALDLYSRYDPDPVGALRREAIRYPSSLRHARALGMPGVDDLVQEHRHRQLAALATRGHWRILVAEHSVRLARDGRWYVCATCGRRMVGRVLRRAARRGSRERHTLWTRDPLEAAG